MLIIVDPLLYFCSTPSTRHNDMDKASSFPPFCRSLSLSILCIEQEIGRMKGRGTGLVKLGACSCNCNKRTVLHTCGEEYLIHPCFWYYLSSYFFTCNSMYVSQQVWCHLSLSHTIFFLFFFLSLSLSLSTPPLPNADNLES